MNTLVIWSPASLTCLRNNEKGEKDAGDADTGDANEDGGEPIVGVQQVEHLGGDKSEEPKRTVVQASHCFLWEVQRFKIGSLSSTCSLGRKSSLSRVYRIGPKPNWKEPRKRTRTRTTRMLLLRIWVRRELLKMKVPGLEETQKMAAKMIAARLMPEPQKTRKTFLGVKEINEGGTFPLPRVSLVNFLVFSSMLSSTCPGYLLHTFEDRIQQQQ